MNIRTKMISILAFLFAILIVIEIGVQKQILLPSFAALEREDAATQMKRIGYALDQTFESLALNAADWGNWADLYQFVQSPSQGFIDANITAVGLKQLKVNGILIVDMNGNRVLSSARALDTGESMSIDFLSRTSLPADFPWRKNLREGTVASGLLRTDRGIMLLAAAPILDGTGMGRPKGMVIMGRLLDLPQLRMIGAQAQANLTMLPVKPASTADVITETGSVTQVMRPIMDVYGHPLMSFRVEVPRRITARGQGAVTYASLYLMGAAITVLVLLVIVLNRVVLKPLARVTRHAVAVGEGADLTHRLSLPGQDEIALLAREFDRMVERVAESRRQLVDRSFQEGFAELAKGVLHNLGNAMTPLGVRLSTLGDRLRDTHTEDLSLAVTELAKENGPTQRRADLEEFLRLSCQDIAATLEESLSDVEVVTRQAAVVQTALSELMRSTSRNAPSMESVRLPELVAQTLEIVPDACRQRLRVDAGESLKRVGAVRVARTVMRLILQNLIINAADAVRDAGREKGVLRVEAEIVNEADKEQLHLHCKDNGVGIPAANLQRVFEKGFSTKSRETNYGIGLHWCANAIAALGGRIWAASEGPGLGASMHLMVPLQELEGRPNT
ncbi:MAG TPA: CHASE4 domain-containing protein [Steroidobacteraceae bacterium]|jgi:sensor domain CHASE-containing protein/anti-sigma regulatory factor (Ser/Thr protein kinase)|nr:CHASE4 domain-containing protein [Steroidobacteraceae bacterium]